MRLHSLAKLSAGFGLGTKRAALQAAEAPMLKVFMGLNVPVPAPPSMKTLGWRIAVATSLAACSLSCASAQVADRQPVPSFHVFKGLAISPDAAIAVYAQPVSAGAATDGLCRDYAANAQICVGGAHPRAPEIKELARALHNDPNLMFEYVRNSVDTEFVFGAHKGALGALIDHSAGPFDQAELLVELLREAGLTARYRLGDIALTGPQLEAWTGIKLARSACEMLAAGGIPLVINGATDCTQTGDVTSATLLHIWVEVDIGGQTYQFDPAYKPSSQYVAQDVRAMMGLQTGEVLAAGLQGAAQSPDGKTLSSVNTAAVTALLAARQATLSARLAQVDLQGLNVAQLLGGRGAVIAAVRPAEGWRQTALPYVSQARLTWSAVPDAYRARLLVERRNPSTGILTTYGNFFLDEIYGRRLEINPVASTARAQPAGAGHYIVYGAPQLMFDGVGLFTGAEFDNYQSSYSAGGYAINLRLSIDHPFASQSSQYGDESFERQTYGANPIALVVGLGRTSQALASKWSREQGVDRTGNLYGSLTVSDESGQIDYITSSGDGLHSQAAAQWLAQFSVAGDIQARLAGAALSQLHVLGLGASLHHVSAINVDGSYGWTFAMGPIETLDLQTAVAVTSVAGDAIARRRAIFAMAATSATLEASVFEQITNAVDSASTARRFAWAAMPEAGETSTTTPRSYLAMAAGEAAPAASSLLFDGSVLGPTATYYNGVFHVTDTVNQFKDRLRSALTAYSQGGFSVTLVNDADLGPGYMHDGSGGVFNSRERGGAFIAMHYDANGDPDQIAHVVTTAYEAAKGGGGTGTFDVNASAELLKDRFVDRSVALGVSLTSGSVGYTSPVLRAKGQGAEPYLLQETVGVAGAGLTAGGEQVDWGNYRPVDYPPGYQIADPGGLYSNFFTSVSFSNSGLQAMGDSRLDAAASTLVSFAAMQDAWSAAPSVARETIGLLVADWWGRRLIHNVINFQRGSAMSQYVQTAPNVFLSAEGGPSKIVFSGAIVPSVRVDHSTTLLSPITFPGAFLGPRNYVVNSGALDWSDGSGQSLHLSSLPALSNHDPNLHEWPIKFARGVTLNFVSHDNYPTQLTSSVSGAFDLTPIGDQGFPQQNMCVSWTATLGAYPATVTRQFRDAGQGLYRLVFRAPVKRTLSQRPDDSCKLIEVYTPNDPNTPLLRYTYDSVGQVSQAYDAIAIRTPAVRGPYNFYIAEGVRGERVDPQNGSYVVETLPAGGQLVGPTLAAKMTHYVDELGRTTASLADGRGRVLERTYPEGDKSRFAYDERDNVTELRSLAKPGSGLADRVVTAAWDSTWNKPAWVETAKGRTVFAYWADGENGAGEIKQAQQPLVDGVIPIWSFVYGANGQVSQTTDPMGLVTTYAYDALANQTAVVVDPSGVNLRTCLGYDAAGNQISQTSARAGLSTCP